MPTIPETGVFRSLARTAVSRSEQLGLALKATPLRRSAAGRALVDAVLWPSDVAKVMSMSRAKLGAYPALLRPRTLNDHLQRDKLLNRDPLRTRLADKLAVRDYVAATVGPAYLNTLYWSGTDLAHAPFAALPSAFVIKANQGSGTNLIVRDAAALDVPQAMQSTRQWLAHDHSRWAAEWEYRWIPPRVLIERLLLDADGKVPRDFKCWCFNGVVRFVQIDFDRFTGRTNVFVDRDFAALPFRKRNAPYTGPLIRPAAFDHLIRVAERLSAPFRFVRVDLYDVEGPVFGEMTFHPSAGYEPFTPDVWNHTLGSWLG